jgi:hypothetical protein
VFDDGKLKFPDQWLHVKNWEKFQYRADKKLPWIRLDCSLLQDRDFLKFDRAEQRDLISIWLLARNQSHTGWIPNDSKTVSRLIQGSRKLNLETLVSAGWLQRPFCYQVDTKWLPSGYQVATTLLPDGNNLVLEVAELKEFLVKKCAIQDRTGQDITKPIVKLPEKQQLDEPELFSLEPPKNGNGNHPKLVSQAWDYYIQVMGRSRERLIFTAARRRMGELRFKECLQKAPSHSPEDALALMMACIDELPKSEFHMGKNDRSTRYIEWENLFGNTKKLEMWISRSLNGNGEPKSA